jgi:hypothetical protein
MSDSMVREVVEYVKTDGGRELRCKMHIGRDGSVYVEGDELEIGFEESPSALEEAIAYLASEGYSRA